MERGLNKLGKFNYTCIYKSLNVFCTSNPFVVCILTSQQIIDFSDDRISCTCAHRCAQYELGGVPIAEIKIIEEVKTLIKQLNNRLQIET